MSTGKTEKHTEAFYSVKMRFSDSKVACRGRHQAGRIQVNRERGILAPQDSLWKRRFEHHSAGKSMVFVFHLYFILQMFTFFLSLCPVKAWV